MCFYVFRGSPSQAAELYRVIEEQNNVLCSLKELANRTQLQTLQVSPPPNRTHTSHTHFVLKS